MVSQQVTSRKNSGKATHSRGATHGPGRDHAQKPRGAHTHGPRQGSGESVFRPHNKGEFTGHRQEQDTHSQSGIALAKAKRQPKIQKSDLSGLDVKERYAKLRDASRNGVLNKPLRRELKRTRRQLLDTSGTTDLLSRLTPLYEKWRNGTFWRADEEADPTRTQEAMTKQREEFIAKAIGSLEGKEVVSLANTRNGSRIIQSALKNGGTRAVEILFPSMHDSFPELLAGVNGQHAALALFEYGGKERRHTLALTLRGHLRSMLGTTSVARTLDRVYAGSSDLSAFLLNSLWEEFFPQAKTEEPRPLSEVLRSVTPTVAQKGMDNIVGALMRSVDNNSLGCSLVLAAWNEVLANSSVAGVAGDAVAALVPSLLDIIDSVEGKKLACYIIGLATPAQRKEIARNIRKQGAIQLIRPEEGDSAPFEPLLKLLMNTDDTVMLTEALLQHSEGGLATHIETLLKGTPGERLLLQLLHPLNAEYLRPWQLERLTDTDWAVMPGGRQMLLSAGLIGDSDAVVDSSRKPLVTPEQYIDFTIKLGSLKADMDKKETQWQAEHPNAPPLADIRAAVASAEADPDPQRAMADLHERIGEISLADIPPAFPYPGRCKKSLDARVQQILAVLLPAIISYLLAETLPEGEEKSQEEVRKEHISHMMSGYLNISVLTELVSYLSSVDPAIVSSERVQEFFEAIVNTTLSKTTFNEGSEDAVTVFVFEDKRIHGSLRKFIKDAPQISPVFARLYLVHLKAAKCKKRRLPAGALALFGARRGAFMLASILSAMRDPRSGASEKEIQQLYDFCSTYICSSNPEAAKVLTDCLVDVKQREAMSTPTILESQSTLAVSPDAAHAAGSARPPELNDDSEKTVRKPKAPRKKR